MDWVNSLRFCIITRGYSSCFCARERKKQLTTAWNMRENGPKKYWKKVERRRCQQWRWNNFATRHRPSCLVKRCRRSDSEIVSLRDVSLRFRTWRMASSAMMKSWAILRTLKYVYSKMIPCVSSRASRIFADFCFFANSGDFVSVSGSSGVFSHSLLGLCYRPNRTAGVCLCAYDVRVCVCLFCFVCSYINGWPIAYRRSTERLMDRE